MVSECHYYLTSFNELALIAGHIQICVRSDKNMYPICLFSYSKKLHRIWNLKNTYFKFPMLNRAAARTSTT